MPWTTRAPMSNADAGGEAAAGRGDGEPDDADGEDAPAPVAVAERTAEEQEGGERERVAGDDPLQRADAAVEGAVDGGERDADDGRIEEGDARAEDRGGDDPATAGGGQDQRLRRGARGRRATIDRGVAHCGQACIVKETIEPGLSTVPGTGFCVSTVSGDLTVVVVTAGAVVEVEVDEIVVVVVVGLVVVVVGRPTE